MGHRVADRQAPHWTWLLSALARRLDNDTREAVLGDLEEAGVRHGAAVAAVAGLLVRRASAPWHSWPPWLALLTVALPIGLALAFASRWWIDLFSIDAFFYIENWTPAYLQSRGGRRELLEVAVSTFTRAGALVGWAWVAGRALRLMSPRTRVVPYVVFAAAVLIGVALTTTTARGNGANAFVFGTVFYGVVLPIMVQLLLIVLPAVAAIRQADAPGRRSSAFAVAAIVIVLTAAVAPAVEGALTFGSHGAIARPDPGPDRVLGTIDDGRPLWFAGYVFLWPVAYWLIATAGRRRGTASMECATCE